MLYAYDFHNGERTYRSMHLWLPIWLMDLMILCQPNRDTQDTTFLVLQDKSIELTTTAGDKTIIQRTEFRAPLASALLATQSGNFCGFGSG